MTPHANAPTLPLPSPLAQEAQDDRLWRRGACLQLAEQRHGVPSIEGAHRAELSERDAEGRRKVAREVDVVDVDQEADNARHRDAAVLDLSVAEEGERLVTAHRVEAQRVEHLAASLRAGAHPAEGQCSSERWRCQGFKCCVRVNPPLFSASPKPNNAAKSHAHGLDAHLRAQLLQLRGLNGSAGRKARNSSNHHHHVCNG